MALPSTIAATGGFCMPCKIKADREEEDEKTTKVEHPRLEFDLATAKAMTSFDLCDAVWSAVQEFLDASEGGEVSALKRLAKPWQVGYAVHEVEYNVLSGGFASHHWSHESDLDKFVLSGLDTIGAKEHGKIFKEATLKWGDEKALHQLTQRYYDACKKVDPRELLASYMLENFSAYQK
jgi:hypothetical protein